MTSIHPFLWFDQQAEEAANFYCSVFRDSKITQVTRAAAANPSNELGAVMTVAFEIAGQSFVALNGGPRFQFSEATSFVIDCDSTQDVDHYWDKLTEGGEPGHCGWLKDKFGLSWQVVPSGLGEVLGDKDPARSKRAMEAMFKMSKLDLDVLRRAANG